MYDYACQDGYPIGSVGKSPSVFADLSGSIIPPDHPPNLSINPVLVNLKSPGASVSTSSLTRLHYIHNSIFCNQILISPNSLTPAQINKALTIIENRKIDKGHSFQYHKLHYMIVTTTGADVYFKKGTEVMVIKCLDGKIYANINDKLYNIREIENWKEYSKNFDVRPELKKEKKKYIPPIDHPWRQNSEKLYSSSIRAHLYGANN